MTSSSRGDAALIGIVLFDGVEELDAVGPYEVLPHWSPQLPGGGCAVLCLSPAGGPVTGPSAAPCSAYRQPAVR